MVTAIKLKENNTVLNLIHKFNKKNNTTEYMQEGIPIQKKFVDDSMQNLVNNSIMEGCFSKENVVNEMAIKKVNKTLCSILGLLVAVLIISYYFVISSEVKLNDLGRETVILNNENKELQNKLDNLKSFNNVDKTLQENNMLQRAGLVIETPEITVDNSTKTKHKNKKIFNTAIGF